MVESWNSADNELRAMQNTYKNKFQYKHTFILKIGSGPVKPVTRVVRITINRF